MQINGVTMPWVYLGMLFSTFAWHNEDHYLYSMNYMHHGEGKTWYGVPGSQAPEFERTLKLVAHGRFVEDQSMLYGVRAARAHVLLPASCSSLHVLLTHGSKCCVQLTTMVSPSVLMAHKVKVYRLFQEPGDFIVTFPRAYHAGFSHGFNVAEACNFALPDWLPLGQQAVNKYRDITGGRPLCFSHDQLLYNAAKNCATATREDIKLYVAALCVRCDGAAPRCEHACVCPRS
ncbi:hypothetical protein EON66_07845 [archaeon]|nr:MAG: hypothetical protein EON66_07845 [archaeon]